jgi:regulatory protein
MTSSTRRRGRFRTEPPSTGAAAQDAEPDQESVARAIALRLLTSSPRSRAQLAEAMARKGVPDEVAARVLDRFTEVGLIDDAEYARMVVRTRHAERGLSRRAIAVELRRRGIDDEVAGDALEQVDSDDEESAARRLVRRKLASTSGLDAQTRSRRTLAALGRRGYPPGLVARLLREELAAQDASADGDLDGFDPEL